MKLAAFYTIRNEMFGKPEQYETPDYSFAAAPVDTAETINYDSGTDFSQAIDGRKAADIWPIIDDLMSAVQTLMPRLYDSVMRDLR
jgi:hypothetical protein